MKQKPTPTPKNEDDYSSYLTIIPDVPDARPILYDHNEKPLIRKIGYK